MEKMSCPGFKAAGVVSGLKKNGQKDLGLIYSEVPANVAGLFTRNLVQAAPVLLDRQRITRGLCRAVIVNSGNANCCTGEQGMQDAVRMARLAADGISVAEDEVLVASTGVIGEPLPVEKIEVAMPDLIKALHPEGIFDFAEAIMTTDTVPKVVSHMAEVAGRTFTITGVAKGAGMIRPDMATMLCFVMTNVLAPPGILKEMLKAEHGRHIRADHSSPLGHTGYRKGSSCHFRHVADNFGNRIRGHDCFSKVEFPREWRALIKSGIATLRFQLVMAHR